MHQHISIPISIENIPPVVNNNLNTKSIDFHSIFIRNVFFILTFVIPMVIMKFIEVVNHVRNHHAVNKREISTLKINVKRQMAKFLATVVRLTNSTSPAPAPTSPFLSTPSVGARR